VDSLLIPIDIQIDDEVVTRNVMVYSVTIKHNRTTVQCTSTVSRKARPQSTTLRAIVKPDGSMLMTERGIVVTEMLQLWNAAPETFVKRLGRYTGYCTLWQGLVGPRSLSNGYGTCAITVARMQREMQKTVQKGYNVNAESALKSSVSVPSALLFPSSC
jgi:hypothetical protein